MNENIYKGKIYIVRPDDIYPRSFQAFLRFKRGETNAVKYAHERRATFTEIVKESKQLIVSLKGIPKPK